MKGGYKKSPVRNGFTIVEVMIFLAVSGVTFLIAANFINGKEAQTEFYQGINQTNYQLRTIINDVSNGNYPLPYGKYIKCEPSPVGVVITSKSSPQPTTAGCIFAGSIIQSNIPGPGYTKYVIAGCQFQGCSSSFGNSPNNISELLPIIVPSMTRTTFWSGGIQLVKLFAEQGNTSGHYYRVPSAGNLAAIGFFSNLSSPGSPSSTNQPEVYYYDQPFDTNNVASESKPLSNGYIVMCFSYNHHQGSITIGSVNGGSQTNTALQIGNQENAQCLN